MEYFAECKKYWDYKKQSWTSIDTSGTSIMWRFIGLLPNGAITQIRTCLSHTQKSRLWTLSLISSGSDEDLKTCMQVDMHISDLCCLKVNCTFASPSSYFRSFTLQFTCFYSVYSITNFCGYGYIYYIWFLTFKLACKWILCISIITPEIWFWLYS